MKFVGWGSWLKGEFGVLFGRKDIVISISVRVC